MTNDEIHALADKHCDAYIEGEGDCIGYEFALTSLEKFTREAMSTPPSELSDERILEIAQPLMGSYEGEPAYVIAFARAVLAEGNGK